MRATAVPVVYKRRHFGIIFMGEDGKLEFAAITGRTDRRLSLEHWQRVLASCSGEGWEEVPEERATRYAFFFEAGARLTAELGGGWHNSPRRLDSGELDEADLEAGDPIACESDGWALWPVGTR